MTTIGVVGNRLHVIGWHNVFEDRFCASRIGGTGGVGRRFPLGDSAWQLAIEKAWSALDGLFFCGTLPCTDSISCFLSSFQSGGVFSGQRPPTIECLVMSGCGIGHEPAKNF